jgi:hypothetical protein
MVRIRRVVGAEAFVLFPASGPRLLAVQALGEATTSGWTHPRLVPAVHAAPPVDGVWDFAFVADPAHGVVLSKASPIATDWLGPFPNWCRGVRIHAAANEACSGLEDDREGRVGDFASSFEISGVGERAIASEAEVFRLTLCVHEDGFRPTGAIHHSGGLPRVEMKKLRHRLVLTVEGPDRAAIENGLARAAVKSAVATAAASGGAVLQTAMSEALARLIDHLGPGYAARIEDQSHWIYWDT